MAASVSFKRSRFPFKMRYHRSLYRTGWVTWLSGVLSEWLTGTWINFSVYTGQLVRLCWFPGDAFDGCERTLDICGKEIYTWDSYFISLIQGNCVAEALAWNDTTSHITYNNNNNNNDYSENYDLEYDYYNYHNNGDLCKMYWKNGGNVFWQIFLSFIFNIKKYLHTFIIIIL